jgi:hypothetical protein
VADRILIALEYLRTNLPQRCLASYHQVSQTTISRIIREFVPRINDALESYDHGMDELQPEQALLVDGTFIKTGPRKGYKRLYSGKHHADGVQVQVLSTLDPMPVWCSYPLPGATHDAESFRVHELAAVFNERTGLADKGYQGHGTSGLITPFKKPQGEEFFVSQLAFNESLAKIRAKIETVNSWLKSWKVMGTRYRQELVRIGVTVQVVFRLLRFRMMT